MGDEPRGFNLQFWGLLTLLMVFGGLLLAMGGKIFDVKWVIFTGLLIMMSGVFFVAAYGLLRQSLPRKRKPVPSPQQESLSPADTTNKLLTIGNNDFIPTVTEGTTNLLKTPASRTHVPEGDKIQ
ncbi:MAG TPA: hypothetical protein VGQ55_17185 [Pyrinomonadaceae bacterium]|nr:hypothetical protein [Pyrinomonadaceae bacterium]